MKTAFACTLVALAGGVTLSTDYTKERSLKIESEIHATSETTEMTRDGEPVEMPGGSHPKRESTWHVVQIDSLLAHEGNQPTKVKRHFESVGGKMEFSMGDQANSTDLESPFEGATLELSADGGEVKIEFVEGTKPDHEGALDGHELALALDALLPEEAVEKDAKWDLDSDQVKRALGTGLFKALYPPPARDESAGGEGGGGGGRRGGMMRGGGGDRVLSLAEWKGKAKLVALDEDVDGEKCAKVELELSAKGDMPEQPMGGGRRRNGLFEPNPAGFAFASTYTIEAEGTFLFALESKRPVKLELEGKITTESEREMRRRDEDTTVKMFTRTEGKLTVKIEVSEEAAEAKKK